MKRIVKLLMVVLMVIGLMFSALNIMSVANIAGSNTDFATNVKISSEEKYTQQSDGCYGAPLNCYRSKPKI